MKKSNLNYQKGFTLVEIMIALLIGLFLAAGAVQIFTSTKNNNRMQENLSRMQENARFAMLFLREDITKASFDGAICGRGRVLSYATNNLSVSTGAYSFKTLHPFAVTSVSTLYGTNSLSDAISGTDNTGINTSDTISVRNFGAVALNGVNVIADQALPADPLLINASESAGFTQGDIALVTDCRNADIFQITSTSGEIAAGTIKHETASGQAPDNYRNNLAINYNASDLTTPAKAQKVNNTRIYHLSADGGVASVIYSITNSGTPAVPGLAKGGQQLVPDIENMQIFYGQRDNLGNIVYVPAGTGGLNMNDVMSVKINLLVRSQDDFVASSPQSFFYNGVTVSGAAIPDRRLRKVYTSTIAIRNRLN